MFKRQRIIQLIRADYLDNSPFANKISSKINKNCKAGRAIRTGCLAENGATRSGNAAHSGKGGPNAGSASRLKSILRAGY